ncbi:hypothetical protein AB0D27_11475 [Streptomyces sp. NPDC048415]|uniref:hypothetical protein n=1 Tax=Streptomyces sp. NPDC048415 TaxID=3154822 RepID=UPI00343D1E30
MTSFSDDFNRADGSPGANWVQVSGTWSIVSNQLSSGSAGGVIILRAAGAMATNDNSAQITIAATGAVSHGVWCRGNTNITQGYLWRNDGTSWNLFSAVGGSFTSIGSFTGAAVAGDVAKVQAVGSTIKGFVNGIQRVSVTDTAVTTGTSVGVRAESTTVLRFDDFTGADVATGTTGDAALSSTATLSTSGLRATAGDSAIASTATLSASGVRATAGSSALTATAALSASGLRATAGSAALLSTANLAADGVRGASGAASLNMSATLAADGAVATSATGSAGLTAAAALTAAGTASRRLDATLAASAALTAAGALGATSGGGMAVSVGLQASGQVAGAVVRGTARRASGAGPRAQRGESAGPRAQRGKPAVPTARGGAL